MKDFEREFEQMVRANRGTIYTVCYMFSNDQDEVADLFQEVLINLWKSLPSREERGDVRSWIYRVSLNVCISLDRKKRRHKTVPLTMDIDPYEETETNQNSRQMDMLRRRIARLGWRPRFGIGAVDRLSLKKHRRCFMAANHCRMHRDGFRGLLQFLECQHHSRQAPGS